MTPSASHEPLSFPPVPPPASTKASLRCAASLIVLRDAASGPEVLLLQRTERQNDVNSGAWVYPGGVLDGRDRELHPLCLAADGSGETDVSACSRLGLGEGALDYHVAAIRECFEECGLLLAVDNTSQFPDLDRLHAQQPQLLGELRRGLQANRLSLKEVCVQISQALGLGELRLAAEHLAYFAYWLTPPGIPRRFDTRFFVALCPPSQTASHDNTEVVAHRWMLPAEAADPKQGLTLLPVTRNTLREVASFPSAAACIAQTLQREQVPLTMPRLSTTPKGMAPVLPGHPAYAEVGRLDPDGLIKPWSTLDAGRATQLSPHVWRVTADNGSVMTGPGTNTYFVGGGPTNEWAVIDPGPRSEAHLQAVLAAAPGPVRWILCTHTHQDHSPNTPALQAATGARTFGRVADHPEWQDASFQPDQVMADGGRLQVGAVTLRAIHTPGHASNHLCFLLEEEATLFTGDHVMQGSTVVINPPDGDMALYLASLRRLLNEKIEWLAPGHGFLMAEPQQVIEGLVKHRLAREAKVLAGLQALVGEGLLTTTEALLARVYADTPAPLHGLAKRSLSAHLHKLVADGRVAEADGHWQLQGA